MTKALVVSLGLLLGMLYFADRTLAAEGAFKGDVVAKWSANGRDMELLEPFGYIDPAGRHWDVPKGTVVDGASIPRVLWSVVGAPFTGKYRKASVVHDYYCETMARPWKDVHEVFYRAVLTEGNDAYHAKLLYGAVYAWGPRWTNVEGVPMRIREAMLEPTQKELVALSEWIKTTDPSLPEIASFATSRFPRRAQ